LHLSFETLEQKIVERSVWLREREGEGILVEPRSFLPGPTKTQSPQIRKKMGEKIV